MPDRADIEFAVFAGQCRLRFEPGSFCGRSADTRPGIGFMLIGDSPTIHRDGKYYAGSGVIGRTDAQRLASMLNAFLKEHPAYDIAADPHLESPEG